MEERIVAADPVTQPDEYRQELLDLLGGDDPVDVLRATPATFRTKVERLDQATLTQRPEPKEWSVEELLGHFFHAEIVLAFRWRIVLAQDSPQLTPYDQDAWTTLPRPPFGDMLNAFEVLRGSSIAMIDQVDRSLWDRAGYHEERGAESFWTMVQMLAGHDRAHLAQLDQTLAAVT